MNPTDPKFKRATLACQAKQANKGKVTPARKIVDTQAAPNRHRSAAAPTGIREESATLNSPVNDSNEIGYSQASPLRKKPVGSRTCAPPRIMVGRYP